ncbi:MAG: hypothetical protein CMK09_18810 [Ponticaulis sp.]|nr:hypothetical protein [Ponticaulis sp.]|tara:strand:- start:134632 stop:135045 length:414 start_codon:yes stop_codon:yes gene_type:complete
MDLRRKRRRVMLMNVTPLIDVVFILLVFFMLTTNFARFRLIGVDAPEDDIEKVKDPAAAIVVLVKADGTFEYDNAPASYEEIGEQVGAIIATDPGRPFIVRPERGVSMQEALDIFQLTREAGAYAVSFSRPAEEEGS